MSATSAPSGKPHCQLSILPVRPTWVSAPRIIRADDPGRATAIAEAVLAVGQFIVYPTETFYGLGTRADLPSAVERLIRLKERDTGKPIPVIAASADIARATLQMTDDLVSLADAFWPGPLTVAAPPREDLPRGLLGSGTTLGLRVSSHPVAVQMAVAAGGLITATSANLSGGHPAQSIQELDPALACSLIVDGGRTAGGAPSTVVGMAQGCVRILRGGAIAADAISRVVGYEVDS